MKFIDDKGKLFGKINIFDFFSLVVVLFLFYGFYLSYNFLTDKTVNKKTIEETLEEETLEEETNDKFIKGEYVEIITEFYFLRLHPEMVQIIREGVKKEVEDDIVIGELLSVIQAKPYVYNVNVGEGKQVLIKHQTLKNLKVKLRLKLKMINDKLYYKSYLLEDDKPFIFATNDYAVSAVFAERRIIRGRFLR